MPRARQLLLEKGYAIATHPRARREGRADPLEIQFRHPDGTLLELHRGLCAHWQVQGGLPLEWSEIWSQRTQVDLGAAQVPDLAPEVLFTVLAIHGTSHLWRRFKWLADIAQFLEREQSVDWARLGALSQRYGVSRIVRLALYLAHAWAEAPLMPGAQQLLGNDRDLAPLARQVKQWISRSDGRVDLAEEARFSIGVRERWRDRLPYLPVFLVAFFRSLLIPTAKETQCIALPRPLRFLYVVIRPVRLLGVGVGRLLNRFRRL
jgi:hypothetical protein